MRLTGAALPVRRPWVLATAATGLTAFLAAACATLPATNVSREPDGSLVVEVREDQSFRSLALSVYDDAGLARPLAESQGLAFEEGLKAGTKLTLPPKRDLVKRLEGDARARQLLAEGEESGRQGEWDEAVERLREARALRPELEHVRLRLGEALLRTGETEESFALLREEAARRPEDAEVRHAFGAVLRERGELEAALAELDEAVRRDEHHARAAYDRARTLQELGRTEEARRAWQRFLYAFPSDAWADTARRQLAELDES
ncbi:MAG: tetratricopeptide repeat protein [Candidatus Eiseniibacteriota bacterium]